MPTCVICLEVLKNPAALPCGTFFTLLNNYPIALLKSYRSKGHVFCFECIVKLVRTVQPYVHNHFCPTCRQQYTISEPRNAPSSRPIVDLQNPTPALANPTLVPPHLRLHVTPSIRRLCLDYSIPKPKQTSAFSKDAAEEPLAAECARLRAENASLKVCCDVWSKRARLHAGTTLGLIGLVRMSKDTAVRTSVEKEELEKKYQSLKRNIEELE